MEIGHILGQQLLLMEVVIPRKQELIKASLEMSFRQESGL